MNNDQLKNIVTKSAKELISKLNQGDVKVLVKYGISEKMWKEICNYIHGMPGVSADKFNILELQHLDVEKFFIKNEEGEHGVSSQNNVSIYLAESDDDSVTYEVEFPVILEGNEQVNTLIFYIILQNENVNIEYSLLEVM